jgi:hypothetical protein
MTKEIKGFNRFWQYWYQKTEKERIVKLQLITHLNYAIFGLIGLIFFLYAWVIVSYAPYIYNLLVLLK